MNTRTTLRLAAAMAALAITACSSAAPARPQAMRPAAHPSLAAAPRQVAPGITLATGTGMPSGPFRITPLYCGRFSKAQQAEYNDTSGLIFKYTNVSASVTGQPVLTVNFTQGSAVAGSNVNGSVPTIGPGQSATADVGAVGDSGQALTFTGCELIFYAVLGSQPGTYAP